MPTYEFRCPEGHEFEKFYRSIAAAPRETACPTCGKIAERQMSAGAGLHFKGSGFYITDYRSKSYKDKAKSEKPSSGGGKEGGSGGASGGSDASKGGGSKSGGSGSSSSGGSGASGAPGGG